LFVHLVFQTGDGGDEDAWDRKVRRLSEKAGRAARAILRAKATTLEGLVVKLTVALVENDGFDGTRDEIRKIISNRHIPLPEHTRRQIAARLSEMCD